MRWLEQFLFGGTLHGMGKESQEYAESQPGVTMNKRHDELQSFHRVLYDAVGQVSPGLSEEAFSTLCSDARSLELNSITLNFRDSGKLSFPAACLFYTPLQVFKERLLI